MLRTDPRQRTEAPDELALNARGELLVLAPAGTTTPNGRAYQVLAERGVRVRVVQEPQTRGCLRGAVRGGIELRRLPTVPHALVLVDRRTALLTTGGITSTVNQPAMVEALFLLFVSLWQRARPEDAAPTRRHRDVAVLKLLATGATDEVAAAQLDVSIRTYRRWVADLMARLGATSRFQAGVLASRDGLVHRPGGSGGVPAGSARRTRTQSDSSTSMTTGGCEPGGNLSEVIPHLPDPHRIAAVQALSRLNRTHDRFATAYLVASTPRPCGRLGDEMGEGARRAARRRPGRRRDLPRQPHSAAPRLR
ncbi:MAG: helix-turn-helix transcriptional regulator [Pseudonocardia sp.]|nr:helix-turn-helix transcriptional regulator [Pseudonocardia sp.]